MSSQPQQFPRSTVFIKKAFQGRFIAYVLLLIVLFGICSAALIYWLISSELNSQTQTAHITIAAVWDRLGITIAIGNMVAALVAGLTAAIVVLYITHRIAGPLYRLETLCKQVAAGRLDGVTHLREKDQLQDLAEAFAAMVESLRARRDDRARQIAAIEQQIQGLATEMALTTEHRTRLAAIGEAVAQLGKVDSQIPV